MTLIDSHTHLDSAEFDSDRELMIDRARKAGISGFITIGAGDALESAKRAIALAEKNSDIWASVGIHPHCVAKTSDFGLLKDLSQHPKVVAIGETGLDFFRDWSPVDLQKKAFEFQIALAIEVKKPIIIHSREAGADCLKFLKDNGAQAVGGVFHCYAENAQFAKELVTIGFKVSFPGTLTFKNAETVRNTAKEIPLEQILLETDAPYMAPVPYRGKRCESAFMVETAKVLATVKGLEFEEIAKQTNKNTRELFKI